MIYTLANTIDVGMSLVELRDANGLDWTHLPTVRIDTVTGEVEHLKKNPDGSPDIDEEAGEVRRETTRLAAPLKAILKSRRELIMENGNARAGG